MIKNRQKRKNIIQHNREKLMYFHLCFFFFSPKQGKTVVHKIE